MKERRKDHGGKIVCEQLRHPIGGSAYRGLPDGGRAGKNPGSGR
jgi:hypothetical protein